MELIMQKHCAESGSEDDEWRILLRGIQSIWAGCTVKREIYFGRCLGENLFLYTSIKITVRNN